MAHCPFEQLSDLSKELDALRALPGMREPKSGIFYYKSIPFLHFHTKDDARWADAKVGKDWGPQINIPFKASKTEKSKFLKEAIRRHALVSVK
jgi:hypothetical protein